MIEQTAKTDSYEMSVDKAKNRWYVQIKGTWERTSQVSSFLADADKSMRQLTRGFTVLSDLTQMGMLSPEAASLFDGIQKRIAVLGGSKMAPLMPKEALTPAALQQMSAVSSGIEMKMVSSRAEAEAWLDQK